MIRKELGFVLQRRKTGEADVIFELLLENGCVVSIQAHGILAAKRRTSLVTEPGSLVSAVFYQRPGGFASLKEGEVVDRFSEIKKGYENMLILSYLLEISRHSARGNESPELFELLDGALHELRKQSFTMSGKPSSDSISVHLLLGFFKVRLFRFLGLLAEVSYCSHCGRAFQDLAEWEEPDLNFICNHCSSQTSREDFQMLRLVKLALKNRFSRFLEQIGRETRENVELIRRWDERLDYSLEHYFSKQIVSGAQLYKYQVCSPG